MANGKVRKLKFGTFLSGFGGGLADWRSENALADRAINFEAYLETARIAEEGLFDFGFMADSPSISKDTIPNFMSIFEPLTILSALAATTSRIGLVGTFTTSYSEPFTTARQLSSLDKLSNGRAGWNAVTSTNDGIARNHGHEHLLEHSVRYRMAAEYLEVVTGLWDSWEDDAFVRDKERGVYVDFDKMHTLDHKGEFFSVQGPLNMERSAQGKPVVFQAGGSEEGIDLAARFADGVYSRFGDYPRAKVYSDRIRRKMVDYGRLPQDILIFPTITPVIGATQEEADHKYELSKQFVDIDSAVKFLNRNFGAADLTKLPLDEPLPDLGDSYHNGGKATAEMYIKMAREEQLTLRQLALRAAMPKGDYVGTPQIIADKIQRLFETGVIDGFIIGKGIRDFVDHVVPILQDRGIYRTQYEADTLRGNLGLPDPVNRYLQHSGGI